jgi:hypothetical protein
MHVGLGEGVSARRVRVSFRAAHATAARQQYYTVRALTLAARCLCHGHAQHCNVDQKVMDSLLSVCNKLMSVLQHGLRILQMENALDIQYNGFLTG